MLAFLLFTGCSQPDKPTISPATWENFTPTQTIESDDGLFSMELQIQPQPAEVGLVSLDFVFYNSEDFVVDGATVTVTPWMPSMDHGISGQPIFAETDVGLYNSQFEFSMSGTWEVTFELDSDLGQATFVTSIEVQ